MAARPPSVTSPASETWQRLVDADENALPFQTPVWMDALRASDAWEDATRLYEFGDGRRVVLPLARRRPLGREALAVDASMPPLWGSGGAVLAGDLTTADAAAILADLAARRTLRFKMRPSPFVTDVWQAAAPPGTTFVPRVAHVLDLSGGFEHVQSRRFDSRIRRNVRRAERSGLTIDSAPGDGLVREFYGLYMRWIERRARERRMPLPLARRRAEPLRNLELIARHLGDGCRIWHLSLEGRPIAALMAVLRPPHAVYLRGASDLELTRPTRANDLIQQLAIEHACATGCRWYHMGESGGVASLARFKEGFGAQPRPFFELRIERLPITAIEGWRDNTRSRLEARLLARQGHRGAAEPEATAATSAASRRAWSAPSLDGRLGRG